jgi:anhydro-N-acetylmuramic acid kinase
MELLRDAKRGRLAPQDLMATATAFTARSLANAYDRFLRPRGVLHRVIVGGGGVYNRTLMAELRRAFGSTPVDSMSDHGVNPKAIEAMAFALLAYLAAHGEPNNVPSATGAKRAVVMGKIIPK